MVKLIHNLENFKDIRRNSDSAEDLIPLNSISFLSLSISISTTRQKT
jgi:hypothetical protein